MSVLILTIIPGNKRFDLHFTNKETEARNHGTKVNRVCELRMSDRCLGSLSPELFLNLFLLASSPSPLSGGPWVDPSEGIRGEFQSQDNSSTAIFPSPLPVSLFFSSKLEKRNRKWWQECSVAFQGAHPLAVVQKSLKRHNPFIPQVQIKSPRCKCLETLTHQHEQALLKFK